MSQWAQKSSFDKRITFLGAADETYRNIVGLHALSGAADIIANCCLESGIAHISAVQEKYCSTLKGM